MYVANFVRSRSVGTVSCSRDCAVVANESGTAQLDDCVIMPRQDLFTIHVDLKYSPSCVSNFFVTEFDRANCLLMSGVNKIAISSAVLTWRTELKPGVFLGTPLGFAGTVLTFESVALTRSANDLPAVTKALVLTDVRSSATDAFVFEESWERSDIVSSKKK